MNPIELRLLARLKLPRIEVRCWRCDGTGTITVWVYAGNKLVEEPRPCPVCKKPDQ